MRKAITIAALIALLAVPLFAVSANAEVCPQGVNWSSHRDPPLAVQEGVTEYCVKGGSVQNDENGCIAYLERGSFEEVSATVDADGACELSHWSFRLPPPPPDPELFNNCTRWVVKQGGFELDKGQWTLPFELEFAQSVAWPDTIEEPRGCLQKEPELTSEFWGRQNCDGWGLMQQNYIDGEPDGDAFVRAQGVWEDPYALESKEFGEPVNLTIYEPDDCLRDRSDVGVAIGGVCTEDGDSQEIGYNFSDGDFDGARLIITRSDGVEVANAGDSGEGRVFFPARAADYSWRIVWFDGDVRVTLDDGKFTVAKCDIEEPPPEDCSNTGDNICPGDEPPEHPPTGADPNTTLAVVIGLAGYALAGIGGSILFMKRRASR